MITSKIIIVCEILFFNVFGIFGNVCLVLITLQRKELRTKSGLLLAFTAISHIICLLSTLINVAFNFKTTEFTRDECAFWHGLYIFAISYQAIILFFIALDIFIAIVIPLSYRVLNVPLYLLVMNCLPVVYGIFMSIWLYVGSNEEVIPYCTPLFALNRRASDFWMRTCLLVNSATLVLYFAIMFVMHYKGQKGRKKVGRESRSVIRRISVIVLVFIFSWYICIFGNDLAIFFEANDDVQAIIKAHFIFFAFICYSQTFYVCLWRSTEYRKAFKALILRVSVRKAEATGSHGPTMSIH